jgi:predicted CXXCH cytochrome family protein
MTAFCTGCHSNFHHQFGATPDGGMSSGSAWIRHPSDVLIPDRGEYANATSYDPIAPVGRTALVAGDATGMLTDYSVTPGSDVVTCISCHRPHGSPYPDMLRWDYDTCVTETTQTDCGCFACHTAKDGIAYNP